MPPGQPTLPAEGVYTDTEKLFIQEQPQNLWPVNQDSNFGQFRKVVTDQIQKAVDQIDSIFNNLFIDTAIERLSSWELEYGLPIGTSKEVIQRRADIKARTKRTAFTRTRRINIVEDFIRATQGGAPIQITPEGIPLSADGVKLWGENAQDITTLYTITEDIEDFSYSVSIDGSVTPDMDGLLRELTRITPAHFSFTVTNP